MSILACRLLHSMGPFECYPSSPCVRKVAGWEFFFAVQDRELRMRNDEGLHRFNFRDATTNITKLDQALVGVGGGAL
jgi:hypothetical protein